MLRTIRPICIQPAIAKIFEALVLSKIQPMINNLISPHQHGFHKGRSTNTNLLFFQNYIINSLSEGHQVDTIYLDFSKAFDLVDHSILISRLARLGFHGPILSWFSSYLSGRIQAVKLSFYISQTYPVSSGVPQGSLLGPFLFKIFIDDISSCITSSIFTFFADDIKIFKAIKSHGDCFLLQNDLVNIQHWCEQNNMKLNIDKCKFISYYNINNPILFNYKLSNTPLIKVQSIKDLGIIFDKNLNFNNHISMIIKKNK